VTATFSKSLNLLDMCLPDKREEILWSETLPHDTVIMVMTSKRWTYCGLQNTWVDILTVSKVRVGKSIQKNPHWIWLAPSIPSILTEYTAGKYRW